MGIPAGPFYIDDTLTFTTNTHRVDTGAATDADSVPTYRVYEDETGTAILNGSMAKLDDANTTGFYSEQLTLSAANGFEVGKSYSVYISATVNSVTATRSDNFKVITNPQTLLSAIDTKTTNLPSDPADASVVAGLIAAVETKVDTIDTVVDAILVDTAEIGVAGAGLTNINLPNQTMDIIGNITGNLSGSVGSVTGAVGSVTGAVGSVTGLTASDVAAIKAKTDSLAFTVAGQVDANIQYVNDVEVNGIGTAGSPWGP